MHCMPCALVEERASCSNVPVATGEPPVLLRDVSRTAHVTCVSTISDDIVCIVLLVNVDSTSTTSVH